MRCKKTPKKLIKPKEMDSITDREVGPFHLRSIEKGGQKERFKKRVTFSYNIFLCGFLCCCRSKRQK